jgi:hypothetical protein
MAGTLSASSRSIGVARASHYPERSAEVARVLAASRENIPSDLRDAFDALVQSRGGLPGTET